MGEININKSKGSAWQSWRSMHNRCRDKRDPNYGGRGIRVCDRWTGPQGYEHFLLDLGERPAGMTLDRVDVDGDYTPANCRWACPAEQSRNTRRNILITYQGRTQILDDWSRETGINWTTLYERIHTGGWTVERALTAPVKPCGNKTVHGSPRRKIPVWEQAAARVQAMAGAGVTYEDIAELSMVPAAQVRAWLLTGYASVMGGRRHVLLPAQVQRVEHAIYVMEARLDLARRIEESHRVPAAGVSHARAA